MNQVAEEALALFAGRLDGITVQSDLEPGLPTVLADPEAIRRALANLIDNAAEAMQGSLLRVLGLTARSAKMARRSRSSSPTPVTASPTKFASGCFCPSIPPSIEEPASASPSLPRSSRNMAARLRAESNSPKGARFLLRLPLMEPRAAEPVDAGASPQRPAVAAEGESHS